MSQRLPVDGFEWIECACFPEDLLKTTLKITVLIKYLKLKWIFLNNWGCHIMNCLFYLKK